jgi:hypothetical protein
MRDTRYLVSALGYRVPKADSDSILCSAIAELQEDFEHTLSVVHGKDGAIHIWPERRMSPEGQRFLDASMNYYFGKRIEVCAVRPDLI